MIKLLVNEKYINFELTKFPDGTSQVWKVSKELSEEDDIKILWVFENEAELFQVCQLAILTQNLSSQEDSTLVVPFLPYGRQDKHVDNNATFALHVFEDVLYHANVCRIETFDAHSQKDGIYPMDIKVEEFHKAILNHHVVVFPDKGAADRYGKSAAFKNVSKLYCEKRRDQTTGEILGLDLVGKDEDLVSLNGGDVLIVDDICDGGMTFIKVTEALNKVAAPRTVDLAVSHGIFSKGKGVLHDAGINKVYTTNSLPRNPEGFKVW